MISNMRSVTSICYPRIGLLGNPSDGYGGKTISAICKNFCAEITLTESDQLTIQPDQYQFDSLAELQRQTEADGYYGAQRIIRATLNVFAQYLLSIDRSAELVPNVRIEYKTDIPRMVGLAGSSAVIIALLRALESHCGIKIDQQLLPSLALSVERSELKIGGGLQDRVVQVYNGVVAMDFSTNVKIRGYDSGVYQPLDAKLLPPLYMAYSLSAGEPTEVFHNNLRARFDTGEKKVVDAMQEFAVLAEQGKQALIAGDHGRFSELMDRNFDLRRSISKLNPAHIEMIETARQCGASAKYAGSGGAIVGVYKDDAMLAQLEAALHLRGCKVVVPVIG